MNSISAHKLAIALATLVAAGFLCAGCSESLPPPNNSPLTDTEKQAAFSAVTRAGDYIIAANSNGIFRVQASTKKWERVQSPRHMATFGQLATSCANSNCVFFWLPSFGRAVEGKTGLYLSQDAGATWKLASDDYDFQFCFQNRDGKLYAIVLKEFTPRQGESAPSYTTDKTGGKRNIRWNILVSESEGKHWRDITANIGTGMGLYGIFPDPTAPQRVCLRGNGIRGYILQATDDNYTKWNSTREWEWRKDSKTDDEFLGGGYGASTSLYMVQANLTNYFDFNFGQSSQLAAFEIQLPTNNFVFSLKQDVEIPVTIKFLRTTETVKLPDFKDSVEFWRIKCISPSSERVAASGKTDKVGEEKDFELLKKKYRDLPDFRVVELSSDHPYTRNLSLSKLVDFSHPGIYRVRLSYDSAAWAWDRDSSGRGTRNDLWGGYFSSPVFTVTIKP
jgi:hypothetical protein